MGVGEYKGGVSTAYLAASVPPSPSMEGQGPEREEPDAESRHGDLHLGGTCNASCAPGAVSSSSASRTLMWNAQSRSLKRRRGCPQTIEKILRFPVLQLNKLYRRNMILQIGILNLDWINCTAYLLKRYHQTDQNICFTIYIFQDHFPAPTRI